jgi:hypothetical protein
MKNYIFIFIFFISNIFVNVISSENNNFFNSSKKENNINKIFLKQGNKRYTIGKTKKIESTEKRIKKQSELQGVFGRIVASESQSEDTFEN